MPTRRQTIIGVGSVAAGSGAVLSAGAFADSMSAGADMRVVVVSNLQLEPARDDDAYVDTEGDEIGIEIQRLNRHAFTDFGELLLIRNEGNVGYDRLTFDFSVLDDPDPDVADVMGIVSGDHEVVETDDGRFEIEPENGLEPGGDPVAFGVTVDLLPDSDPGLSNLPESTAELELGIVAERLE